MAGAAGNVALLLYSSPLANPSRCKHRRRPWLGHQNSAVPRDPGYTLTVGRAGLGTVRFGAARRGMAGYGKGWGPMA